MDPNEDRRVAVFTLGQDLFRDIDVEQQALFCLAGRVVEHLGHLLRGDAIASSLHVNDPLRVALDALQITSIAHVECRAGHGDGLRLGETKLIDRLLGVRNIVEEVVVASGVQIALMHLIAQVDSGNGAVLAATAAVRCRSNKASHGRNKTDGGE